MRVAVRDSHGRFVGRGYTGRAFYEAPTGERVDLRGVSAGKYEAIQAGMVPIRAVLPEASRIKSYIEKADKVIYRDKSGRFVGAGYSGQVKADYYRKGKLIGSTEMKGLSRARARELEPRAVGVGRVIEVRITNRDGSTVLKALREKGVSVRHLKTVRVIMKWKGHKISLTFDLTDKPEKLSKLTLLASCIRLSLAALGLSFSDPRERPKYASDYKRVLTLDLTIIPLK